MFIMSRRVVTYILVVAIIIGGGLSAWVYRYNIFDYIELYNYNAPIEVSELAGESSLNDYGKRLFYVSRPTVLGRADFNRQCTSHEQTIVLGCYSAGKIYIFKVDDTRLEGVEQVTAAHEMLHVAYNRLSSGERKHIDSLIDALYKKLNDQRINILAENYNNQDPGSVPNELHSIIATEVSDIGSELESYYSRYFANRQQVVNYATAYEQVFEDLRTQVSNYDSQLASRKEDITSRESSLKQKETEIQQLNAQMSAWLQNNQVDEYNNLVPTYNNMVASYNTEVQTIKTLIEEYNSLVEARNTIVVQQQDLAQSIDSRPTSIGE